MASSDLGVVVQGPAPSHEPKLSQLADVRCSCRRTRNSGGHASATAPVNAEPDHRPLPSTVLVPVMAPASREILDDGQAMAGLGQVSRCGPAGGGPRLRAVVDHRDAGRTRPAPHDNLEPAALAGPG